MQFHNVTASFVYRVAQKSLDSGSEMLKHRVSSDICATRYPYSWVLTLIVLMWRTGWAHNNARK